MAIQVHGGGIVEGIITGAILMLVGWGWSRGRLELKLLSKRERQKALMDMESPDYLQRKQRNVFKYIGLATYFLGARMLFSFSHNPAFMACRLTFALAVLLCGGMAMANATVMNEYGMLRRRKSYEKEELKEQQRAARKRELDSLR